MKVTRVDIKFDLRNWDTKETKSIYYTNSLPQWSDISPVYMKVVRITLTNQCGESVKISNPEMFSFGHCSHKHENIEFATMLRCYANSTLNNFNKLYDFIVFFTEKQERIDEEEIRYWINKVCEGR